MLAKGRPVTAGESREIPASLSNTPATFPLVSPPPRGEEGMLALRRLRQDSPLLLCMELLQGLLHRRLRVCNEGSQGLSPAPRQGRPTKSAPVPTDSPSPGEPSSQLAEVFEAQDTPSPRPR